MSLDQNQKTRLHPQDQDLINIMIESDQEITPLSCFIQTHSGFSKTFNVVCGNHSRHENIFVSLPLKMYHSLTLIVMITKEQLEHFCAKMNACFDDKVLHLLRELLPYALLQPRVSNEDLNGQPAQNEDVVPNGGQIPLDNHNRQEDFHPHIG